MFEIKPRRASIKRLPPISFDASEFDAYSVKYIRDDYDDLGLTSADAGIMLGYLS